MNPFALSDLLHLVLRTEINVAKEASKLVAEVLIVVFIVVGLLLLLELLLMLYCAIVLHWEVLVVVEHCVCVEVV